MLLPVRLTSTFAQGIRLAALYRNILALDGSFYNVHWPAMSERSESNGAMGI
jgi:hypothetical protein